MTVKLDWPPHVVERLTEEARSKGLSLDAYVLQAILKENESTTASYGDERRRAREEAGRNIRELRKGNNLGSDVTIRDVIEEGRRF